MLVGCAAIIKSGWKCGGYVSALKTLSEYQLTHDPTTSGVVPSEFLDFPMDTAPELQMRQNLADDKRIFDAAVRRSGNYPGRAVFIRPTEPAAHKQCRYLYQYLSGPIEHTLKRLCLYALWIQHIPIRLPIVLNQY